MARIEIHIDWLPGIRCIGIRGCCGAYWLNIQIDPDEYRFAADEDEPDEDVTVPLVTAEAFYTDIHKKLAEIQEEAI